MKRFLMIIVAAMLAISGWALSPAVRAQSGPMTEEHIERIRSNCLEAQSTLRQIHASDAGLRVNLGPLYESISTKLMAPFNSRVALNKYDGPKLIEHSALYERQLNEFRANYKVYEEAMSKTLRINCVNEPVAFYDSVAEARGKRQAVHQNTTALQKTIQEYKNDFEAFAKQIQEKKQ